MSRHRTLTAIFATFALLLAVWLSLSGVVKLLEPDRAASAIADHNLIPSTLAYTAVITIAALEVTAAMSAIAFVLLSRPSLALAVLSVVFSILLLYASLVWANPPSTPTSCGCGFSWKPVESWGPIVVRNGAAVLGLFAGIAILRWVDSAPIATAIAPPRSLSTPSSTSAL